MYAMLSRTFILILQMNIIFTEHYSTYIEFSYAAQDLGICI